MEAYRVFTVEHGNVTNGAKVERIELSGVGVTIAAVTVGERGRGRCFAFVPVAMEPPGENESGRIFYASIGSNRSGAPNLIPASEAASDEFAIIVLRPVHGYRGGVMYHGIDNFQKLAVGEIADGAAGRMAGNQQYILIAPRGVVFGTTRTGRIYGDEPTYHYVFDGERILYATPEERRLTDAF